MSVFVSLSVKAVHLELVSNLTTEAFVACLRHFIDKRDSFQFLLMSEHWLGLHPWKSPTLGWSVWGCCEELQNTSYSNVRLTFEEPATVLIQMEACLNSRPLASIPCGDGINALMHLLIRRPHVTLPDPFLLVPETLCIDGTCVMSWCDTFGRCGPQSISLFSRFGFFYVHNDK